MVAPPVVVAVEPAVPQWPAETCGDGETNRASGAVVDEVSVTAADRREGDGEAVNGADLVFGLDEADLLSQLRSLSSTGGNCLQNELVGGDIDVVRRDSTGSVGALAKGSFRVEGVERLLGFLKLGERNGNDKGGSTGIGHLRAQGLFGDGNIEIAVDEPSAGETSLGLQLLDDFSGLDFTGDTNVGLLSIESKIPLHSSQNLGVKAVGGRGRGAIDDWQEDCESSEERSELHVEGSEDCAECCRELAVLE
jgi:hypothetical protein